MGHELANLPVGMPAVSASLVQRAQQALQQCQLCPRVCNVDRTAGKKGAFCRLDHRAWVYRELLSVGEEPAIGPTWLIDVGGCSLRCLFCSEWANIVNPQELPAVVLHPAWFLQRLALRRQQGARTLSWVGGDPTVSAPAILQTLSEIPAGQALPVVWNCNGLLTDQSRELLAPVVTTWLLDLKFGNALCSKQISGNPDAHPLAQIGQTLDFVLSLPYRGEQQEFPQLLARHLIMPGHWQCCTLPILTWVKENYPTLQVNWLSMYLPPDDSRRLRRHSELKDMNSGVELRALQSALPHSLLDGRPWPGL